MQEHPGRVARAVIDPDMDVVGQKQLRWERVEGPLRLMLADFRKRAVEAGELFSGQQVFQSESRPYPRCCVRLMGVALLS